MAPHSIHEDFVDAYEEACQRGWKDVTITATAVVLAHPHSFRRLQMPLLAVSPSDFPQTLEHVTDLVERTGRLSSSIAREQAAADKRKARRGKKATDDDVDAGTPVVEVTAPLPAAEPVTPAVGAETVETARIHVVEATALRSPGANGPNRYRVIERRWSDGTVDFACAAAGCDKSSHLFRGTSTHFARIHKGPVETVPAESMLSLSAPAAQRAPMPDTVAEEAPEQAAGTSEGQLDPPEQVDPTPAAAASLKTAEGRLAVVRSMLYPSDDLAAEVAELHRQLEEKDAVIEELHSTIGQLLRIAG